MIELVSIANVEWLFLFLWLCVSSSSSDEGNPSDFLRFCPTRDLALVRLQFRSARNFFEWKIIRAIFESSRRISRRIRAEGACELWRRLFFPGIKGTNLKWLIKVHFVWHVVIESRNELYANSSFCPWNWSWLFWIRK